jgi:hypothetical protein
VARLPSAANIADAYPAFTSVNNFFGWEDIEGRSQRSLFSMDGTRLATIGKDGTSRMLDVSPEIRSPKQIGDALAKLCYD